MPASRTSSPNSVSSSAATGDSASPRNSPSWRQRPRASPSRSTGSSVRRTAPCGCMAMTTKARKGRSTSSRRMTGPSPACSHISSTTLPKNWILLPRQERTDRQGRRKNRPRLPQKRPHWAARPARSSRFPKYTRKRRRTIRRKWSSSGCVTTARRSSCTRRSDRTRNGSPKKSRLPRRSCGLKSKASSVPWRPFTRRISLQSRQT